MKLHSRVETLTILVAVFATFALTTLSQPSYAAAAMIVANVSSTLVDTTLFGGCMARLSVDPRNSLPSCGSSWVSFSCTGDFAPQELAFRMFDQAQLALTTGKQVKLFVRDNQLHNGYCVAYRIDVIQ